VLTNYGLRVALSIYYVQGIEQLNKVGKWIKYRLSVPELGAPIHVALPRRIDSQNLIIGILGSRSGKSTGILLNPLETGLKQYKRMTTKGDIKVPSPETPKTPVVSFIK